MNNNKLLKIAIVLLMFFSITISKSFSQENKREIIRQVINVETFHGINAGNIFEIYVRQGTPASVEVETNRKYMESIETTVKNGILFISGSSIKNPDELNVYITAEHLTDINLSGAAELTANTPLREEKMLLKASGASEITLEVEVDELTVELSGASDVKLSGKANILHAIGSGASSLYANKLVTRETYARSSGASGIHVNTTELLDADVSGASNIKNSGSAVKNNEVRYITDERIRVERDNWGDTTHVNIAGLVVEVVEDDSTQVSIGRHKIIVDEDGNVKYHKIRRQRFNGHWAGVEIGINGYLTPDFNMNFPGKDEYLDLRMEKSIVVNMNIWDQNFALSRNGRFGVLTGIGFSSHNYRFNHQTTLTPDSSRIVGFIDEGISIRKTKLVVNYINIPLIFEFQTNQYCKTNSFHIGVGAVLGIRFASHTKKYYNELNKDYTLTRYNPVTGKYDDVFTATSPGSSKAKQHDDFHLNPFKVSGTFRIGWGFVNLFANYSFTTLFREDKGPELYPFEVGLSLVGW